MKKPYLPIIDFYLLIPCYNNLHGLIRSLQSIEYNFHQLGVLIVDDGSTEPVQLANLRPHLPADLPLEIIRTAQNQGITKALNTGLEWLESKNNFQFIARLDCGDICEPNRFYRQVEFLQQNPQIDLVGSWCLFKNFSTGVSYQYRTATEHKQLIKGMHFKNMFIHPTVMWRTTALKKTGPYPENFPHAEDYGLFYKMLSQGKCAVIPENLVSCEINPKGISLGFRKEQLKSRIKVVKHYGKSNIFRAVGVIKLMILIAIPPKIALLTKQALYGS